MPTIPPPGGPHIEVDAYRLVCAAHGEHLREHWPSGFLIVGLKLVQAALASPALAEACARKTGERADVAQVNVVTETRPFCYFVDRAAIRDAFMDAEILTIGRCHLCARTGPGGPYSVTLPSGVKRLPFVCLECALDAGEREHRAHPNGRPRSVREG